MGNHLTDAAPAVADPAAKTHARWGLILFAVYVVIYGGFVALTAFNYHALETRIMGVNLAVLYGFGLILSALVLALIYTVACSRRSE